MCPLFRSVPIFLLTPCSVAASQGRRHGNSRTEPAHALFRVLVLLFSRWKHASILGAERSTPKTPVQTRVWVPSDSLSMIPLGETRSWRRQFGTCLNETNSFYYLLYSRDGLNFGYYKVFQDGKTVVERFGSYQQSQKFRERVHNFGSAPWPEPGDDVCRAPKWNVALAEIERLLGMEFYSKSSKRRPFTTKQLCHTETLAKNGLESVRVINPKGTLTSELWAANTWF